MLKLKIIEIPDDWIEKINGKKYIDKKSLEYLVKIQKVDGE